MCPIVSTAKARKLATTPERSKTMPERFVVFLFDDMHWTPAI
jgi:hypothetical protein